MIRGLFKTLFSARCHSCGCIVDGEQSEYFCTSCLQAIEPIHNASRHSCNRCDADLGFSEATICFDCLDRDPALPRNHSLFYYHHPIVRYLVHKLKFESRRCAASDICLLLKPYLDAMLDESGFELIVPVPLSRKSLRKRGFNQVELILDQLGIRYENALGRHPHSTAQSRLSRTERIKGIRGQFFIGGAAANYVAGKRILIVDDIFTTGSTVEECSRTLKAAGASEIESLCFFRD